MDPRALQASVSLSWKKDTDHLVTLILNEWGGFQTPFFFLIILLAFKFITVNFSVHQIALSVSEPSGS